jgi:hypothetical protein
MNEQQVIGGVLKELLWMLGGSPIFISDKLMNEFDQNRDRVEIVYDPEKCGFMVSCRSAETIEGELVAG